MDNVQVRVYFNINRKGRSKRAQAILRSLRERVETAEHGYFLLYESEVVDGLSLHTTKKKGVVYYDIGWADEGKLPKPLRAIKPLRVTLSYSGRFDFSEEGLHQEGDAEVRWKLSLTAPTVKEAFDLYVRIREGTGPMRHHWVNKLSTARVEETCQHERNENDELAAAIGPDIDDLIKEFGGTPYLGGTPRG